MAVKEYRVVSDGEVLKTYKSLPAAKQLAEKEIANVYVGDECVYKVVPEESISPVVREYTKLGPGAVFETVPEFPEFCWTELIVNAGAHRDCGILFE